MQTETPRERSRSLRTALLAAVPLVGVLIWALTAGPVFFLGLASFAIGAAQIELYAALRKAGYNPMTIAGTLLGLALLLAVYFYGLGALGPMLIAATMTVVLLSLRLPQQTVVGALATTALGLLYLPGLGAFILLINHQQSGAWLAFFTIAIAALNDAGAFVIGGRFKHKRLLAPRISPKKSVQGLIGGILLSFGVAVPVMIHVLPHPPTEIMLFVSPVTVLSPLGDLAQSQIKRGLGIKDMSGLIPGHGGFGDRIDSILFVAPLAYLLTRLFGWA